MTLGGKQITVCFYDPPITGLVKPGCTPPHIKQLTFMTIHSLYSQIYRLVVLCTVWLYVYIISATLRTVSGFSQFSQRTNFQALTRCQKVKSRKEREIWNPHLEFREEKREISRSVFWFEKRTRIFAKKMEKF